MDVVPYAGYKGSNQTTAETNTFIYYIVTNKKGNVADSGIIPCGIGDHALFILSGMPGFLKLKRIQKLLQSEAPKT